MSVATSSSNPFIEPPLNTWVATETDLERYILSITDRVPQRLLQLAVDPSPENTRRHLLEYIRDHRVQRSIKEFDSRFGARAHGPDALATVLRTVRHYHNGLRGGLLYLSGRITEDTRLERGRRDRIAAAGPLFAAFDEFTDNPHYLVSTVTPMLHAVWSESQQQISVDDALAVLTHKGMLRRDPPHLERFYGVIDELVAAGSMRVTADQMDQEDPIEVLPEQALNAWHTRRIITKRPDVSCAGACAFMYGNESVAGQLYGKLYKGFKRFQREYGLSDHACDYFGDHASEDGEDGAPAFEASHASLMLDAPILYAMLEQTNREAVYRGLHLFLETYADLVENLSRTLAEGPHDAAHGQRSASLQEVRA